MNKLRRLRTICGSLFLIAATLLFLDFTGTIHGYLGWVAKVQFLPALLGVHFTIILVLFWLTFLFGRLYCSVICPLGLFQDAVSRFASLSNKKRKFSYSPAKNILRYTVLALFVAGFFLGAGSFVALLDPYGAFGRMISALFAPLYQLGNNVLATMAENMNSYAFYSTDVILMAGGVIAIAAITLITVSVLAWRGGRTYCNSICPVGTILGFISRFSRLVITVDESKCNGCRKCVRTCKASCITPEDRKIDYSRCVVCFDCIDSCNQGAITYSPRKKQSAVKTEAAAPTDKSKRDMLAISSAVLVTSALKAEEKMFDGGVALIDGKKINKRTTPIVPAGAISYKNFTQKCVGCQLCVTVCPNNVLRPSTSLMTFMQPEASYEVGFCRPECTKCSEVCPAGAITPIDLATKSSTKIGVATFIRENCVILTDGIQCEGCATHCPTGAISLVAATDKEKYGNRKIPVVDQARCIGCGACENLCPARPFSAVYVEGVTKHSTI